MPKQSLLTALVCLAICSYSAVTFGQRDQSLTVGQSSLSAAPTPNTIYTAAEVRKPSATAVKSQENNSSPTPTPTPPNCKPGEYDLVLGIGSLIVGPDEQD